MKPEYDIAWDTFKYTGNNSVVVLNQAGEVVTTWARNSSAWRIVIP